MCNGGDDEQAGGGGKQSCLTQIELLVNGEKNK